MCFSDTSLRTPPFSTTGSGTRQGLVDFMNSSGFVADCVKHFVVFVRPPKALTASATHKINKPSSVSLGCRSQVSDQTVEDNSSTLAN